MSGKIPRVKIHYYDDSSPDTVMIGSWEIALTERKYGAALFSGEAYEPALYQAYLAARRSGLTEGLSFDQWGELVALIEPEDEPGKSETQPGL